jgi:hypothetical protein
VAFHHTRCKLLILRANNLRDQEVDGSNPFAPTNYFTISNLQAHE